MRATNSTGLLVAIEDVTERRTWKREGRAADAEGSLPAEMSHRVNNGLHIIASILLLKAQTVQSERDRATPSRRAKMNGLMAVRDSPGELHPSPFGAADRGKDILDKVV